MPTKRQLEEENADLRAELEDSDARVEQLEATLAGIASQADEALPEAEDEEQDDEQDEEDD